MRFKSRWLDKVYNFNDADHLVLHRDDYNEDENRMRITSGVITGTYILGDNFSQKGTCVGELAARQKAEKFATNAEVNEVARIGKSFYPVEGAKASGKNSWGRNRGENLFMLDTEDYLYVAAFNYKDLAFSENIKLSRLGIASSDVKGIKELWTGQDVSLQGEDIPVSLPKYVMGLIGGIQDFTRFQAISFGETGPNNAGLTMVFYLYQQGFTNNYTYGMGFAAATSWVVALLILGLTVVNFKVSKKWVHYD